MKTQYVRELAQGQRISSTFALASREMRCTRAGEAYLALDLADRTGRISGIFFRPPATALALQPDSVVHVEGTVTAYRGTPRISVTHLAPSEAYDAQDFLPPSDRDEDELIAGLRRLAASVENRDLKRIVKAVFSDVHFLERFRLCPAAQSYHHAHVAGLLEHTVAVSHLCDVLAGIYPAVDRDMLVTAALLHDIGKVDEMACNTSIEYTDAGRLIGHVVLGERRMRDAARSIRPGVRDSVLDRLSHAILSHHGELEWGAPKRPSTLEALLLHHADNVDAKADGFIALTTGASSLDQRWTDAQNLFRRPLYAPVSAADERPLRVSEDIPLARASA